jgi:hypothetical protein
MSILRRAAWLAALSLPIAAACTSPDTEVPPSIPCSSAPSTETMEGASDVRVVVDDALPEQVRADVRAYLTKLWSTPVEVVTGAPPASGDLVVVSVSEMDGYRIARADEGGRKRVVLTAAKEHLVAGTYALLEELGIRFFHPMEEYVPAFDGPRFPRALDVTRKPVWKTRGIQAHVLHPIEYMRSLHEPSEEHLAEAKKLVDWLVKTGQNHLQWTVMRTVPWETFAPHARAIADYAHSRGINVGCSINLNATGSLQGNYVLVSDPAKYDEQIEQGLRRAMEVPWDDVEIALGEFLADDPEAMLQRLDSAVKHLDVIAPGKRISVQNHVGNYENLYSSFRGNPRQYFYHVPKYADPRLGQTVHTVFWHDLYRPTGMYEHENFFFQREFIFEELAAPEQRRVRYFPESAYWIATDVDVPAFLPEFIESRLIDIQRLDADTRAKGLRPLDGHVLFTSGHEWGYWLTDYLVAKMLWDPQAKLETFVGHYGDAYGSCAAPVSTALSKFIELQRTYLYDKKLIPYVSGEDNAIDLGSFVAGRTIRTPRKKFDDLVTGTEDERVAFETNVLGDLEIVVRETRPLEDDIAARCRGSDGAIRPWCEELRDGMRIVRLRLEHSLALYRSILAYARGDAKAAEAKLADGRVITEQAKDVIFEREKHYRFDVGRLTDAYDNPTLYKFGYLRQAHTQCFWRRQDEQARRIVEENLVGSAPTGLLSCLD